MQNLIGPNKNKLKETKEKPLIDNQQQKTNINSKDHKTGNKHLIGELLTPRLINTMTKINQNSGKIISKDITNKKNVIIRKSTIEEKTIINVDNQNIPSEKKEISINSSILKALLTNYGLESIFNYNKNISNINSPYKSPLKTTSNFSAFNSELNSSVNIPDKSNLIKVFLQIDKILLEKNNEFGYIRNITKNSVGGGLQNNLSFNKNYIR